MGRKLKAATSFTIIIMIVFLSFSGDFGTLHFGAGKAYADTWTLEAIYYDSPSYHDRDIVAGLYDQSIVFGAKFDGPVELFDSVAYDPTKTYCIATSRSGDFPVYNIGDYLDSNDYALNSDEYALEKYVMTYNGSDYSGYFVAEQYFDGGYIYVFSKPASPPMSTKTPSFNPAAGTYAGTQSVTITSGTAGSTIYYTTDGTTPTTASTVYSAPILVAASSTIKAIAVKSGMTNSDVGSATYTISGKVATPTFSPTTGSYTNTQSVTITSGTAGSTIYYTTDGTTPTTASAVFSTPILVAINSTIKAIAVKSGMANSDVGSATYTIQAFNKTWTLEAMYYDCPSYHDRDIIAGLYDQRIVFGAKIDGSVELYDSIDYDPMKTYRIAISRSGDFPVSNIGDCFDSNDYALNSDDYALEKYVMTYKGSAYSGYLVAEQYFDGGYIYIFSELPSSVSVKTPSFSPAAGTYASTQSVTITSGTAGSTIYYTTDGTTPTTASTVYSAPILVAESCTIKAIAVKSGMTNSGVGSATYTISGKVATPTFSPTTGSYTNTQSVTITSETAGSTIYYTTDGTTPTTASTVYSTPVLVAVSSTIKAIAVKSGMANSDVASAVYTIMNKVAAPTFNPIAGTYTEVQNVAISSVTAGSTIYYTLDGTTPTTGTAVYSAPISVTTSSTIKAIAVKNGMLNSDIASAAYTILNNNYNYEYKYLNNRLDEIRVNGILIMKYEYDNNGNLIKATKVN